WHEGNDGAGSGLDADLLDGKHANEFQSALSGVGLVKVSGTGVSYITDNSANWNTAYSDRYPNLTGLLTGSSVSNNTNTNWNNLQSGWGYQAGGLNQPNSKNAHFLSIRSNGGAYGAQLGMRAQGIYYRGLENNVWGS